MLLTIDIGNTNINFGIFQSHKLRRSFTIPTKKYNSRILRGYLKDARFDATIICSVVPKCTKLLERDLGKRLYIIGKDIKAPIKNLYRKPKEVGQDRLVNAYAGIKLYGAPLVVVDFGTAVTIDIISKNKEYLGGMILPGLRISLDALAQYTALLPKVKLSAPKELIGQDTKSSMLSGIVYGFAAAGDDLVRRIREKIGKTAKVIGTGGNISLIAKYCKNINKIDKHLTLKGLNLIYQDYVKNR